MQDIEYKIEVWAWVPETGSIIDETYTLCSSPDHAHAMAKHLMEDGFINVSIMYRVIRRNGMVV